jgi:hypothetical protein
MHTACTPGKKPYEEVTDGSLGCVTSLIELSLMEYTCRVRG